MSACVSRSLTACRKILFRQAEQLHPTFQSGAIALGKYMKTKIAILKELFCSCDYILMVFCKLNINLPSVSAPDSAYEMLGLSYSLVDGGIKTKQKVVASG